MSRFNVSETIPRPLDEVWSFATDWAQAPRWMKGVDRLWVEDDGPSVEGARIWFEARGKKRGSRVSRWDPPRCVALESVQGGVKATYTYRFEAEGEGKTRVELEAVCEFGGAMKIMGPLIGWMIKRTDGGQLRELAAALGESGN